MAALDIVHKLMASVFSLKQKNEVLVASWKEAPTI